jgi:hypothetical protein
VSYSPAARLDVVEDKFYLSDAVMSTIGFYEQREADLQ